MSGGTPRAEPRGSRSGASVLARASAAPVSVVIPCYRCAGTIRRAVRSVMEQTAPPAQLILVEDAGGDGTLESLRELRKSYGESRVEVRALRANGGPARARNAGWEAASEPYVAFLDADNTWHPRKLEVQCGWMEQNPQALFSGHGWLRVHGRPPPQALPGSWTARPVSPWRQFLANRFPTSSVMIRRSAPLRYHADRAASEDFLLWTQLLCSGWGGYLIDLPLAHYYKPLFGHSGVSGDLWAMEKKELLSYRLLMERGCLSPPGYGLLVPYSLAKYLRRVLVSRRRAAR